MNVFSAKPDSGRTEAEIPERKGPANSGKRETATARNMSEAEKFDSDDLQAECRRLQAQVDAQSMELNLLRARFARHEAALRGSQVIVYTQDRNLRYTSLSHAMLGRSIEDILGRTDEEILPRDAGQTVVALKREALTSGKPQRTEIALEDTQGMRWHNLHIEPLRNEAGDIVGLTCAAVDVTERKEGEAHLRLLLRELTHRSKNLLAVIQAMARQTARHAGSIEVFLDQFAARLQALAASHDLLVRESWYGASIGELIHSQLAVYIDRIDSQVALDGPAVALKPEAAQNLGLALHELANNAVKFGALSVPDGRISISWNRREGEAGGVLQFDWHERHGPAVKPRRKQGFGSMVIERNLARALDAKIDLDFNPDGLHCHITIPASQLLAAR